MKSLFINSRCRIRIIMRLIICSVAMLLSVSCIPLAQMKSANLNKDIDALLKQNEREKAYYLLKNQLRLILFLKKTQKL